MYQYIKVMNNTYPVYLILHQNNKAHGLSSWDFELPSEIKLLIIPDAATNDIAECKKLIDSGIKIICLDHHVKSDNQNNPAIVVNNQTSSNYTNKNACGAHITYNFLKALDEYYWQDYADKFVDLVALADLADVMSIKSESTKAMVNYGLANINNKMLQEIIRAQEFSTKGRINPFTITFYITPLVNSFLRLATFQERQLLIQAFCEDESQTFEYTKRGESFTTIENIYEHVVRIMKSHKGKQDRARDKAVKKIMDMSHKYDNCSVPIIDVTSIIDNSLTGLVAIKISESIHKPVLLVKTYKDVLSGSGRAFNNCPIDDFRQLTNENPYISWGQGHNSAFGCELPAENIQLAIEWFNDKLKDVDMSKVYNVDFILTENDIDISFIQEIDRYKDLWGHGIEEPVIAVENIELHRSDIVVQGKNYDSIMFKVNDIKYVQFKLSDGDTLYDFVNDWTGSDNDVITINIVGECSINEFRGVYEPQVCIKECEIIV